MSTAADIVTRALRTAKVIAAGETPAASEMADGIADLNEMMGQWTLEGIRTNWTPAASTDTITLPDEMIRGIRLNLACEMAPQYGVDVAQVFIGSASLAVAAADAKEVIKSTLRQKRVVGTDISPCHGSTQSYWTWFR